MTSVKRISTLIATCIVLLGCEKHDPKEFQGYVEGEFTYISAETSGEIKYINVKRGQHVAQGSLLFSQDDENQIKVCHQISQDLAAAIAERDDLKEGSRPEELEVTRAQLAQAITQEELAKSKLNREERLAEKGTIAAFELETSQSEYRQKKSIADEYRHSLEVKQLPARDKTISAQEAKIESIRAQLAQAEWTLSKKKQVSPLSGIVHDVYFRNGESVNNNHPIISLISPEHIKVRFFIPQKMLNKFKLDKEVLITCDGCEKTVTGTIDFISSQAEFTPPVMYSQKRREKMVFLIEARPISEQSMELHPGQPVKVVLR